jgi:hypothetical protein
LKLYGYSYDGEIEQEKPYTLREVTFSVGSAGKLRTIDTFLNAAADQIDKGTPFNHLHLQEECEKSAVLN